MRKTTVLVLHVLALGGLVATAIALATWQGALWPFDLRFSTLMTIGGLVILFLAWSPAWLVLLASAAALNRYWLRLALWPIAVLAMVALHATFGPARGFMPLDALTMFGALSLYTIPVALALVIGSALREAIRPRTRSNQKTGTDAADGRVSASE